MSNSLDGDNLYTELLARCLTVHLKHYHTCINIILQESYLLAPDQRQLLVVAGVGVLLQYFPTFSQSHSHKK